MEVRVISLTYFDVYREIIIILIKHSFLRKGNSSLSFSETLKK